MRPFFKDDDFNFLTEIALGSVYRQAADAGEVLTTVDRIHDGQPQSWVDEWTATADRLAGEAAGNAGEGLGPSAASQYLRASLYYSVATYSADGTGDPGRFASLWEKHRAAWDQFVNLGDFGGRSPSGSRSRTRPRRCPGISSVPARPVSHGGP